MPWRLIGFILVLTLFILFAGMNTHLVEVNFGPLKIENIPMFVALFLAFVLGAILTLPFSIVSMAKKKKKKIEGNKKAVAADNKIKALPANAEEPNSEYGGQDIESEPEEVPAGKSKKKKKK